MGARLLPVRAEPVGTGFCSGRRGAFLRTAGRGLPGGNSLSFASPKESKQSSRSGDSLTSQGEVTRIPKGDPAVCDPCASLRGNLRCSVQAGSRSNSLRCTSLRQSRSLIRLNLRSSAQTEGVGARNTNNQQPNTKPEYLKEQGHAPACPCSSWSSLSWGSVFAIRTAPSWLGRGAQRQADQGSRLSEPKASSSETLLVSSTAGCPVAQRRGPRLRVAFLLGTFLWRSKEKCLARRGETRPLPSMGHRAFRIC